MKVVLGVGGGVAAYKAAELTRALQRRGASVQVVLTAGAHRFVTPLTLASLSGRQVLTSLWNPEVPETVAAGSTEATPAVFEIEHIQEAQAADCVVVAPATANLLARLAHGLADDLLTTIALASTAPLVLAPAMNVNMWNHPATQANLALLVARGAHVVAPEAGYLACGMVGAGRLAEPAAIADAVHAAVQTTRDLLGETVLISAGGTREPIDAVRFLGNRSSGRMGFALAEEAVARGAHVVLVSTVTGLPAPAGCEVVAVDTAASMQDACLAHLPRAGIVAMAAAVSDYRVLTPAHGKRKKTPTLTLELTQNPDILRLLAARRSPGTFLLGFAAETACVLEEGRRKLHEKGVDAIVANDVSQPGSGFESASNAGMLLTRDQEIVLPLSSKREMARRIFEEVIRLRARRAASSAPA